MKMFTAKCNFSVKYGKNITLEYQRLERQEKLGGGGIIVKKARECPVQSDKKVLVFR